MEIKEMSLEDKKITIYRAYKKLESKIKKLRLENEKIESSIKELRKEFLKELGNKGVK